MLALIKVSLHASTTSEHSDKLLNIKNGTYMLREPSTSSFFPDSKILPDRAVVLFQQSSNRARDVSASFGSPVDEEAKSSCSNSALISDHVFVVAVKGKRTLNGIPNLILPVENVQRTFEVRIKIHASSKS
jgi:hypothetical protein